MFRPSLEVSMYVFAVLEICFDRDRVMFQPCLSCFLTIARCMFRPSLEVCFDRARFRFSTVLKVCFNRVRSMFQMT